MDVPVLGVFGTSAQQGKFTVQLALRRQLLRMGYRVGQMGTEPDACILVVNSIDADAYIRDTMDGLQAIGKAPTVLLAMSDKEKHIQAAYGRSLITPRQMSREEIRERLRHLEDTFGLPAVEIASGEGQRTMAEVVIRYFAEEKDPCPETELKNVSSG